MYFEGFAQIPTRAMNSGGLPSHLRYCVVTTYNRREIASVLAYSASQ